MDAFEWQREQKKTGVHLKFTANFMEKTLDQLWN